MNAQGAGWSGYPANSPFFGLQASLDWTRTFNPNVVNEARLNYGRNGSELAGNSIGNTVPVESNLANALASINAPSGYAAFGFPASPPYPKGKLTTPSSSKTTSPGRTEETR